MLAMYQRVPMGAEDPHAPPQYPLAWDPQTFQIMRDQIVRKVGAQMFLALGITSLALAWAPLFGLVIPICVLAIGPMARRLADYYAAYFPLGFPDYRALNTARTLSVIAVCLSVAFHILMISWTIWLNTR
jgi:hypothetical protein